MTEPLTFHRDEVRRVAHCPACDRFLEPDDESLARHALVRHGTRNYTAEDMPLRTVFPVRSDGR